MKTGDLVRIRKERETMYDPEDDRLGKIGLVTEDLKKGYMAWILWPVRPHEATMDLPEDLEVVSAAR